MKTIYTFLLISTIIQLGAFQFIRIHGYIKLYEIRVESQKHKSLDYILDGLFLLLNISKLKI